MSENERGHTDRRNDDDRRKVHDLDHFVTAESEDRSFKERRSSDERRSGWVRIGEWVSMFAKVLGIRKPIE